MHSGITQAKKGRSAAGSVASKAKKGGNPLSGVSNPLSGGADPKKAGKSIASKASKTASKAGAKVTNSHISLLAFFVAEVLNILLTCTVMTCWALNRCGKVVLCHDRGVLPVSCQPKTKAAGLNLVLPLQPITFCLPANLSVNLETHGL